MGGSAPRRILCTILHHRRIFTHRFSHFILGAALLAPAASACNLITSRLRRPRPTHPGYPPHELVDIGLSPATSSGGLERYPQSPKLATVLLAACGTSLSQSTHIQTAACGPTNALKIRPGAELRPCPLLIFRLLDDGLADGLAVLPALLPIWVEQSLQVPAPAVPAPAALAASTAAALAAPAPAVLAPAVLAPAPAAATGMLIAGWEHLRVAFGPARLSAVPAAAVRPASAACILIAGCNDGLSPVAAHLPNAARSKRGGLAGCKNIRVLKASGYMVYIYIYIYIWIHRPINECVPACMHVWYSVCVRTDVHDRVSARVFVCLRVADLCTRVQYVWVCVCTCMHVFACACAYMCLYVSFASSTSIGLGSFFVASRL